MPKIENLPQPQSGDDPHVQFVPMVDDDGVTHDGSHRCVCDMTQDHRSPQWDDLLAEQLELLAARDQ